MGLRSARMFYSTEECRKEQTEHVLYGFPFPFESLNGPFRRIPSQSVLFLRALVMRVGLLVRVKY